MSKAILVNPLNARLIISTAFLTWAPEIAVLHSVKPLDGVREAARELGVNHGHLSRVLRGLRQSKKLLQRYNALARKP